MKKKTAGLTFLGVAVILAVLLLTKTISVFASTLIIAVVMALLGLLSRGFTRC